MANIVTYGFMDLQGLFAQRVTPQIIPTLNTAVDASLAEANRQITTLTGLFVKNTRGGYKLKYRAAGTETLQPLDEKGRALVTQGGTTYGVAFPLQGAGTAWGADYVTLAKMTVEEVNNQTAQKIAADARWMRNHILAALFTASSWTFNDKEHDALTIQPLANGDSTTYNVLTGAAADATDTHQLAQAASIADNANPFPIIYTELKEHPENRGEVVCLIPTNLKTAVEALTNFKEDYDPALRPGNATDVLVGRLTTPVPGTVIGRVDKCWIVEWPSLPDNYIVAVTTDGEPAIGMREHPEPELQGFKRIADRNDHPFYESQYVRWAGFGAWNRVGAVVYRIGNASYAAPTGYTAPIG